MLLYGFMVHTSLILTLIVTLILTLILTRSNKVDLFLIHLSYLSTHLLNLHPTTISPCCRAEIVGATAGIPSVVMGLTFLAAGKDRTYVVTHRSTHHFTHLYFPLIYLSTTQYMFCYYRNIGTRHVVGSYCCKTRVWRSGTTLFDHY